jgi:choline dehydrogenase-like flavoprotein
MHTDARKLDNGTLIEGDICIVGAGACGISMALDWINTPYKVILLEGGGFEYDDKVQDLYAGKNTGQNYFPLKSSRLHYFGGTTGHWGGYCSTFDEIDFLQRNWVPWSGWPLRRADLDPFYARAHKIVELGPYNYSLAYWQYEHPYLKTLLPDENVVWNKMWQFSPPTRFGEKYKDTIVNAPNVHLFTFANVVDITANDAGTEVRELVTNNFEGRSHRVRAKKYILACNGIQNPRLLLASNKQVPKGLGNGNDLVGRFFMDHLEIKSAEMYLYKPDALKLYALTGKPRAELSITAAAQTKHRILNGTASLTPLKMARKMHPNIENWSREDPRENLNREHASYSEAAKNLFFEKINQTLFDSYEMFTRMEQAPNPDSRVTLDTEKDALGVPRAKLNWILSGMEKRSIRKLYELIGIEMGKAGVGRMKLMDYLQDPRDENWPDFTGGGWHHMGTTRMSEDPGTGVVDANCKVHGISNLFIAGDSIFATSAAPNPTLTIIAFALRLSDHIREEIRKPA